MRWRDMKESGNVEDRRGMGVGGYGVRLGGLGGGGLVILLLVSWLVTGSPLGLISDGVDPGGGEIGTRGAPADEAGQFASRILGDTEETWRQLFGQMNRSYREPTLVLFSDAVSSACGTGSSAVGPFYCPGDHKVYLDLTFYIELEQRFGAPGDFARAYVLAHEVGHHVQNQLGILGQRGGARSREEANALSVAQELQADCFAGVWGHYAATRKLLEPGDVDEGLNAAAAIGDDRIQRRTQGQVTPESWTHGSSEQRASWFRRGLESGQPSACDTSR